LPLPETWQSIFVFIYHRRRKCNCHQLLITHKPGFGRFAKSSSAATTYCGVVTARAYVTVNLLIERFEMAVYYYYYYYYGGADIAITLSRSVGVWVCGDVGVGAYVSTIK